MVRFAVSNSVLGVGVDLDSGSGPVEVGNHWGLWYVVT